jgi:hypothetical protein
MLRLGLSRLSRKVPALDLWLKGEIPNHTTRDFLALMASLDFKSLNKSELEGLVDNLSHKTIGISPNQAFPLLVLLNEVHETVSVPRGILDDISDCLLSSRGSLSAAEYVRSLELLASMAGALWDPTPFMGATTFEKTIQECDSIGMIKLASLRVNKSEIYMDHLTSIKSTLSPIHKSKLAFYTSDSDLLPLTPERCPPAAVVSAIQYFAAWGDSPDRKIWQDALGNCLKSLSPVEAQSSLFALLALGVDPTSSTLTQNLYQVANKSKWSNFQAGNLCRARMESLSITAVPVRVPQIAVERKKPILDRASKMGHKFEANCIHSNFICDFKYNKTPFIIRTIPWDPFFRIFSCFVPPEILQVDSSVASEQLFSSVK